MSNNNNNYNEDSMQSLQGEEQVRTLPHIVFNTGDRNGALNGIWEIIINSMDEAREGYGDTIKVYVEEDGTITVEDYGRGIRVGQDSEGNWNWKKSFCTLYSSGKYRKSTGAKSYKRAAGTNGVGLAAMQFASEFMEAKICYDGKANFLKFSRGKVVGDMITRPMTDKDHVGSIIRFKPDDTVFAGLKGNPIRELDIFVERLSCFAMTEPGITFILNHYSLEVPMMLRYDKGIIDYLEAIQDESTFSKETLYIEREYRGHDDGSLSNEDYDVEVKIAMSFCGENSFIEAYHNSLPLIEGGKTVENIYRALGNFFVLRARNLGKIGSNEFFKDDDFRHNINIVLTTSSEGNVVLWKGQTKAAVGNVFIGQSAYSALTELLYSWAKKNETEADKITNILVANKQAREKAEEASKTLLKKITKGHSLTDAIFGFTDCILKDPNQIEVFFAEGNSASSALLLARKTQCQAVYSLGGKILNGNKASLVELVSSNKIINMMRVLGCGIENEDTMFKDLPEFDINNLRFGKIIIATDADSDGGHIRSLVLGDLYVLCPSVIKSGRVYILETPLYTTTYNGAEEYAYSEKEQIELLKECKKRGIDTKKLSIYRSKGLGENDNDFTWKHCMNPETRRIVQVKYDENEEKLARSINNMMGKEVGERRRMIMDYFSEKKRKLEMEKQILNGNI